MKFRNMKNIQVFQYIDQESLYIARIDLANNLTVVTHNTQEFERFQGLQLEDLEVVI